jgi:hypothetical protein
MSAVRLQPVGDLLPSNDGELMGRSWHSIQRTRRGGRLLLDTARSNDRHLQPGDGEARHSILWQLPGRRSWRSEREDYQCCNRDSLKHGHRYLPFSLDARPLANPKFLAALPRVFWLTGE